MSQATRGQTPSGTLTRVVVRRTKEWVHQGWMAGDGWRPRQMARLTRRAGRTVTPKAGAGAAPMKMITHHQQI